MATQLLHTASCGSNSRRVKNTPFVRQIRDSPLTFNRAGIVGSLLCSRGKKNRELLLRCIASFDC